MALTQMLFREFCEISENTFPTEHLQTTTSGVITKPDTWYLPDGRRRVAVTCER